MSEFSKDVFTSGEDNGERQADNMTIGDSMTDAAKKELKKELMGVFRKFGYLGEKKDYEVRIKLTSGNIAWINIRGIETIK
ncbi:MAG TPA: hypothetical protein ENG83_07075 [Nitrospirae bacterium]|nr:hypothetical protein BMS3Abin06_01428 [bacterium BMS3Abin06]HDH11943.1 hypothetical protein [Nitrospirota bacterium]HDZ01991.1 hypothetical protein [Nitrospirota bacterium]